MTVIPSLNVTLNSTNSGCRIEWYVNIGDGPKKVDLNKPNVEMNADGTLEITAMTSLDEGEYHCTASNTNGKAMSISAKLVKASK